MAHTCTCDTLKFVPPFDPGFKPAFLKLRKIREAAKADPEAGTVVIAIERDNGAINRYDLPYPKKAIECPGFASFVERIVKFMLWSAGGYKVMIDAPAAIVEKIKADYTETGARAFDYGFFKTVYARPIEVVPMPAAEIPQGHDLSISLGGNMNGNRIGFDLGGSDFKLTAMVNGESVWQKEVPWDPYNATDAAYHYDHIKAGFEETIAHLPGGKVDAIGGSSAGVIVDNELRHAGLIKGIKDPDQYRQAQLLFKRLKADYGVPMEVANDGDVSALVGRLALGKKGIIGLAMGTSEAVGYIDNSEKGVLTGRISELAFAPVDLNKDAAVDPWSGDAGVGALYFSQQAVNKLGLAAGFPFKETTLPLRLKEVQKAMEADDPTAVKIYEAIGIYLGYTLPWYAEFYDYTSLMLLGRVSSGKGGDLILATAKKVLTEEFPEYNIDIFMPDEQVRRLGQSAAAASLPEC
ncbi:MAG: ROK family protein [Lentisphaeraceae bacterium]|nr:ROK family protein [Lentisphaeraceae bacterium]